MAFYSKTQLDNLLKDAQGQGIDQGEVVQGLVDRGDTIEGYDQTPDTASQAGQQAFQQMQPTKNPVSQWADQTVQQNTEAKKDWNVLSGIQDPIGWATKEIPAVAANAVKGVEKVAGGVGQFAQGVAGLAGNVASMAGGMFNGSLPQEQDTRFNEGLQSFGTGMQGINEAWSGALEILGSPLPLLPDFIEKPVTHAYGAAMGAVDSGENALLNAFGVPEGSQLNSFIRQASQNAINTAAMGVGARKGMNGPKEPGVIPESPQLLDQRAQRAQQAFQETGIDPTPSMISKSPVLTQVEALAAKGFFGSKLTNKIKEVGEQMKINVERTINEKAPSLNEAEIGNRIYGIYETNKKQHQELMDTMFTEFKNNYGATPASTYHLENSIKSVLDQTSKNLGKENPMTKELTTMYNNFQKGATFENIQATRTAWRQRLDSLKGNTPDPILGPNAGLAQKVYTALTDDMIDTVNAVDKQAGTQLQTMNRYYAGKLKEFNSHFGSTIENAANLKDGKSFENIISTLVKPGNYSQLPAVKNMLGEAGMEFVQAGFLSKVMKTATDLNTGEFSPVKFAKEINKYGDETIRALFDDKGYYLLNNLKTIGERTQPLQKVMEGSQTGFLNRASSASGMAYQGLTAASPVAALVYGDVRPIAMALTGLATDYGVNKFLTSEFGKKVATGEYFKDTATKAAQVKKQLPTIPEPLKKLAKGGENALEKIRQLAGGQITEQEKRNKAMF